MSLMPLSIESLNQCKGGVPSRMVARQLARIASDIAQAPDQPEWREVTFKIRAKPRTEIINNQVELLGVTVEFVASHKNPSRITSIDCDLRQNFQTGQMEFLFEVDAPDNHNQRSLLDPLEAHAVDHHDFEEGEEQGDD